MCVLKEITLIKTTLGLYIDKFRKDEHNDMKPNYMYLTIVAISSAMKRPVFETEFFFHVP